MKKTISKIPAIKIKPIPAKVVMHKPFTPDERQEIVFEIADSMVKKYERYCDTCSSYNCPCSDALADEASELYAMGIKNKHRSDETIVKLAMKRGVFIPYRNNYEYWEKITNPVGCFTLDISKYIPRKGTIELNCNYPFEKIDSILTQIYGKDPNKAALLANSDNSLQIILEDFSRSISSNLNDDDEEDLEWSPK